MTSSAQAVPAASEVLPGIYQIPVPMIDSPLRYINAYLLRGERTATIVDTGWNTPDAWQALEKGVQDMGFAWEDIGSIVVTHIHPDHYGLAGKIRELSRAHLALHKLERVMIQGRYSSGVEDLLAEVNEWLRIHGVPREDLESLSNASMGIMDRVIVAHPDMYLEGGETILAGPYEFEVIWTPGHSAGHICLYDREKKLFLSGDHVLGKISPNISYHPQSPGNPLADFLESLRMVATLDVETVLPAHGEIFHDLPGRVRELIAHHEERLDQVMEALGKDAKTAYQIASGVPWGGGRMKWDTMNPFSRRMAVMETLSHLELLRARGNVARLTRRGIILYVATD